MFLHLSEPAWKRTASQKNPRSGPWEESRFIAYAEFRHGPYIQGTPASHHINDRPDIAGQHSVPRASNGYCISSGLEHRYCNRSRYVPPWTAHITSCHGQTHHQTLTALCCAWNVFKFCSWSRCSSSLPSFSSSSSSPASSSFASSSLFFPSCLPTFFPSAILCQDST